MATFEPSVSGQNGSGKTFGAICRAGCGLDVSEQEIFDLFKAHYNPRCVPPWSDAEIRHKIDDAYAREPRRGWLLKDEQPGMSANGAKSGNATSTPQAPPSDGATTFKLRTTRLSTVKAEPVEYLVEGYIFKGKVNLIAGPGGRGKSTLLYDQIASHTLGKPAWGLNYPVASPFEVLIFAGEEYFKDTIVPRLMAVGADLDKIIAIEGVVNAKGEMAGFHFGYLDALKSELKNNPKIGLVTMDPITSLITGTGANQNDEGEVRELLEQLKRLAEDTGVTFEATKNFNKNDNSNATGRVSGTHAYTDVPRANYVVDKDPDNADRRIFSPLKINGPDEPSSFAFHLEILTQEEALRAIGPCDHLSRESRLKLASQLRRPVYEGKTSHTADDLVRKQSAPSASSASATRIKAATEWLKERLVTGPAGSTLVTIEGDRFLGHDRPHGDSPDDNARILNGRVKWWREQILKSKLGGKSRKLQAGWNSQPWFFTLPGHSWPPDDSAVVAAIDASKEDIEESNDASIDGKSAF